MFQGAATDVWAVLHLELDEAQQMLLVHTAGMMNVRIDFAHVVEVADGRVVNNSARVLRARLTDVGRATNTLFSIR